MKALVLLCGLFVVGCAGTPEGAKIDDQCIAGRLRDASAAWLNENRDTWKVHSDYTAELAKGDRLLSADCSEALIALAEGDFKALEAALDRMKANDD